MWLKSNSVINYGPADNDCDITWGKVFGTYGAIVAGLGLLLILRIIS